MRVSDHRHASVALPPFKELVPLVQGAGLAAGQAWTAAGNLTYTGIRSPDRPARSESLYWLGHSRSTKVVVTWMKFSAFICPHIECRCVCFIHIWIGRCPHIWAYTFANLRCPMSRCQPVNKRHACWISRETKFRCLLKYLLRSFVRCFGSVCDVASHFSKELL